MSEDEKLRAAVRAQLEGIKDFGAPSVAISILAEEQVNKGVELCTNPDLIKAVAERKSVVDTFYDVKSKIISEQQSLGVEIVGEQQQERGKLYIPSYQGGYCEVTKKQFDAYEAVEKSYNEKKAAVETLNQDLKKQSGIDKDSPLNYIPSEILYRAIQETGGWHKTSSVTLPSNLPHVSSGHILG